MDKENKLNNAYDPDAAELLKGLDLDDDEEDFDEEPAASSSQSNHSLVNMLTTSANLESLTASSSLSPSAALSSTALSSPADEPSKSSAPAKTAPSNSLADCLGDDEEEDEDTVIVKRPNIAVNNDKSANSSQEVAENHDDKAHDEAQDNKLHDAASDVKSVTPIKPFEVRVNSSSSAVKTTKQASETDLPKTPAGKENDETDEYAGSNTSGRRPPVPPPMPSVPASGTSTSNAAAPQGRVLREGEIVITSDALNEMLPGGRNDEARDLAAIKFNDNNWYTQVFNEDYLRTVPKSSPRQTAREVKFIVDRLGIESGARVLDLCCGFGRHTIELARRKFEMVGLDLSMVMLKKALADAQAKNMAIKFVHGDMRKLSFKSIFDAIYNVQTSFGYFDDHSNFKVLQGIFRALKPGGVFLIETVNRDFMVNELPLRLWWKGTECMLLEEIDMDYLSGVLKVQRSFVFDTPNRAPWEQKIQIRLYSANEMRALLMRAGFNVLELSGDYSLPGAHFGASSPKNIFVAEKPIK